MDYICYWNEKYYRNGFCDGIIWISIFTYYICNHSNTCYISSIHKSNTSWINLKYFSSRGIKYPSFEINILLYGITFLNTFIISPTLSYCLFCSFIVFFYFTFDLSRFSSSLLSIQLIKCIRSFFLYFFTCCLFFK